MKRFVLLASTAIFAFAAAPADAGSRPPVTVSPDLQGAWVMQLGRTPGKIVGRKTTAVVQPKRASRAAAVDPIRTASYRTPGGRDIKYKLNPAFLPQQVDYAGNETPGTIIIDTRQNFLFLVEKGGKARRYGVGTGKPGFEWAGTHKISRKSEWPDWRPPAEMIQRERAKGRDLPVYMAGGPENPLGARALYLGSTLYRIHGTNQPWTIGGAVSSGCIRMRNEDVVDLYERVRVGAKVTVI